LRCTANYAGERNQCQQCGEAEFAAEKFAFHGIASIFFVLKASVRMQQEGVVRQT
jgi:hypothetical protein